MCNASQPKDNQFCVLLNNADIKIYWIAKRVNKIYNESDGSKHKGCVLMNFK